MNRRTLIMTLAALMVISLSAVAYAGRGGGPGWGGGPGYGCPGWGAQGDYGVQALSPEQKEKLDVLRTEHLNKVAPLRKDIYAKGYELESLMVDPAANAAKIKSVSKELGQLKGKLFEERTAFRAGLVTLGVEDYGRGHMGPGFGRHHRGRGFGPQNCPGFGPGQGYGMGMGMGPNVDDEPAG
ncbi:Spy/CpxP family protein refolding chaperone [Desulfocurvus sp. DL9XJH121]